jgi:hypothetical protein
MLVEIHSRLNVLKSPLFAVLFLDIVKTAQPQLQICLSRLEFELADALLPIC